MSSSFIGKENFLRKSCALKSRCIYISKGLLHNPFGFLFKRKELLLLIVLATLFTLFFSRTTSPLYHTYGYDSAAYMLAGQGMWEGKLPYLDFALNKGPMLYFLMALAQIVFRGSFGVWCFQTICCFLCLVLVERISAFLLKDAFVLRVIVSCSYLFYLALVYEGGNLTEEYSNLFSLFAIYLFFRAIFKNELHKKYVAILLGMCAMSVAFIRINDIALIAAVLFCCLLNILAKKERVGTIIRFCGYGLLGGLIITIPTIAYLWSNGLIKPMWFNYIVLNGGWLYGSFREILLQRVTLLQTDYGMTSVFPMVIACILGLILYRKAEEPKTMISIFLICGSTFVLISQYISPTGFFHYLITSAIIFSLTSATLFHILIPVISKHKMNLIVTVLVLFSIYYFEFFDANIAKLKYAVYSNNPEMIQMQMQQIELAEEIPVEDKNSVLAIDVPLSWYAINNIYPYEPWVFLRWALARSQQLTLNFEYRFTNEPPKWVVLKQTDILKQMGSSKAEDFFIKNYINKQTNAFGTLYKYEPLKES